MNNLPRPHLLGMLAGLFLAAGLVLSASIATTTWLKVKNSRYVSVKGSAKKDIQSDLVIWRGSFTAEAADLLAAQRKLKDDAARVEQFLRNKGVTNFLFMPIVIEEVKTRNTDARTVAYHLAQTVRVETTDVERISTLDRDCSQLVEAGVLFTAQPPDFIYTKSAEAKIEMLAEATKDARARADQIAQQGGCVITGLHDAEMGVFQITPRHEVKTSWDGMNDTSTRDKTITAVVSATFALK
jgi:uncharacterized protein